jgi:hypothetical protein
MLNLHILLLMFLIAKLPFKSMLPYRVKIMKEQAFTGFFFFDFFKASNAKRLIALISGTALF